MIGYNLQNLMLLENELTHICDHFYKLKKKLKSTVTSQTVLPGKIQLILFSLHHIPEQGTVHTHFSVSACIHQHRTLFQL